MIVTHKLTLDLTRAGVPPRIDVSQDDRYTRDLEIRLLSGGAPFCPPEGCSLLIRYEKPDRVGGSYDALPDGTSAWKLEGNVLTVALAPQVCTVPGTVRMVISFLRNTGQISCFDLLLDVHRLPKGIKPSKEYINVMGFVPQPAKAAEGQYLRVAAVDEHGRVTVVGADTVDGKTPIKGVDYWTDGERAEMMEEVDRRILEQLADKSQVGPGFANSLEECTDVNRMYVLPDGFLYAYLYTEVPQDPAYTNLVPTAQSFTDAEVLNETGYMDGYYASASSPYYGADGACVLTGWIPNHHFSKTQLPPTLYIKGAAIDSTNSHCRIQYSGDKTNIGAAQGANIPVYYTVEELGEQYYRLTPALRENGESQLGYVYDNTVSGFVRFSLLGTGENLIITFDEPIEESPPSGSYGWMNTGCTFVATGFEERFQELESAYKDQEDRITAVEKAEEVVPGFVETEARAVVDRVLAAQGENSFLLAAVTDLHYGSGDTADGILHGAQALEYIHKRLKLDALAVLGDYTDGYPTESPENAVADFQTVNELLDGLRTVPNFRLPGNHDGYPGHTQTVHRHINGYSDGLVWGDRAGGYGYRDFGEYRLRILCVNTQETRQADDGNSGHICCSRQQYRWFIDALDLSAKEDAGAWRILILSHQPLDWYEQNGQYLFGEILHSYTGGTAGASGDLSWNFAGRNGAKILANIHGHIHNLLTGQIFRDTGAGTKTGVQRISTPEACAGRENQYADPWAEITAYPKAPGTARDTSFCIYCIDPVADTICAICYGAGYDRSITC